MMPKAELNQWLTELADIFHKNEDPVLIHYTAFVEMPELALGVVELLDAIDEHDEEEERPYYSACVFALDICVAQLQVESERGTKLALKCMDQLMTLLATLIQKQKHTLSFWLPILNAFYEVHAELSQDLKDAYLELASVEDEMSPDEEATNLSSIRELILELSDLSVFDIAENFFAQSYAMPPDFFTDLVFDLYSIEEGKEIALLTLLHPKQEVRDVVVAVLDQLMDNLTLSPISLTRLQAIKNWFPVSYHDLFHRWIKLQRKKGVVFSAEVKSPVIRIKASEVDGSGAQGVFVHLRTKRQHRLCGLLFKLGLGIKDAWITPVISKKDIEKYYDEAFIDSVMLREVDQLYLQWMTEHFLAVTIAVGGMPDLHLLEMQEELGLQWRPMKLDIPRLIEEFSVQISPFTEESMQESFKRSKAWPKNKSFTESWYMESPEIDKLVNHCCSFIEGVKVCRFEEATALVFSEEMELQRDRWLFHFLWMTLWLKVQAKPRDKTWSDCFLIAYAIHNGQALDTIPLLHEICFQSVVNSIETMQERRTHLNRQ
ncbi:MAG: hypothetical protein NTW94_07780 [Legionellales bacterium]|nr:hypothetical protein [Legionellales bacterium]